MLVLLLVISGILAALAAVSILILQMYKLSSGKVVVEDDYNGPAQVSAMTNAIIRYMIKRSIHFRKFCIQYVLHVMVRFMHYVDIFTTYMYAKSRNWFVKNAVKNKGTVPHFWEHLKVYKQEIDKEKEEGETK
jgi:hypothetical protein